MSDIADVIGDVRPNIIVTHWPYDTVQAHAMATQMTMLAVEAASGIRPGKRTAEYLDYVLTRITVVGAAYLTLVCCLPEYMIAQTGIPLFLGGTSLLIVVNVTVDTISQIQSHLLAHQYGDLIKKAKLKGRLR